jgi:hypothetical protein
MNVPGIKDPVRRRLHLVWIIPYVIVAVLPMIAYEGGKEVIGPLLSSLRDVWTGR